MGKWHCRRQLNPAKMTSTFSTGCITTLFLTFVCSLIFWFWSKIYQTEETRKLVELKAQADQEPVFGNLEEEKLMFAYERQKLRLKTLQNFCDTNPALKNKNLASLVSSYGKRFSILRDDRTFECRVAKSGTTYRAYVLWNAFHPNQTFYHQNFLHPVADEQVEKLSLSNYQEIAANYEGGDDNFKVTFVQDDWLPPAYFQIS